MYGYDPDRRSVDQGGGCREALLLTRIAFEVLLPPIGVIMLVIALIVSTFFLIAVHIALILIPAAIVGGVVALMIRRDRRAHRELEEEAFGGPKP